VTHLRTLSVASLALLIGAPYASDRARCLAVPASASSGSLCAPDPDAGQTPDKEVAGYPSSFDLVLQQGPNVLIDTHVTIPKGYDMSESNADPCFILIVKDYRYDAGWTDTGVYLHTWETGPNEWQTNFYMSIRATLASDHKKKGNNPLFRLAADQKVSVLVRNICFKYAGHPREVSLYMYPEPSTTAAAVYLLYYGEYDCAYYNLPLAVEVPYGQQVTMQVRQGAFTDHDGGNYIFGPAAGLTPDIGWENIPSPTPDGQGRFPAREPDGHCITTNGDVWEVGLSAVVRCIGFNLNPTDGYRLTVGIIGPGSVLVSPSDKTVFAPGEVVKLTAVPSEQCDRFVVWQGPVVSNQAEISVTMNADTNITAVFYEGAPKPGGCCTGGGTCEIGATVLAGVLLTRRRRPGREGC
jgi:hypothetical protein